jgi:hypothetical protein
VNLPNQLRGLWSRGLDAGYSNCLRAFRSLGDVELDSLIVLKRAITARLDLRMVNENIRCAAIRSDKAEALIAVEPLHGSLCYLLLSSFTLGAIRASMNRWYG